ncbi:MAG: hypothetical protein PHQ03_07735 [Methylococcales bacterium]|nr:hypothetical protein [Methylococcales bacterium]
MQYDTNGTQFTFAEGTVNVLIRSSASALNLTVGDVIVTATGQIAQKITIPETSFDTSLRSENSTLQHITVSSTGSTDASTGNFQFDFSAGNDAVIPTALTLTGGAGDDTLTGGTAMMC